MTALQLEPSAQAPCTRTMFGFGKILSFEAAAPTLTNDPAMKARVRTNVIGSRIADHIFSRFASFCSMIYLLSLKGGDWKMGSSVFLDDVSKIELACRAKQNRDDIDHPLS